MSITTARNIPSFCICILAPLVIVQLSIGIDWRRTAYRDTHQEAIRTGAKNQWRRYQIVMVGAGTVAVYLKRRQTPEHEFDAANPARVRLLGTSIVCRECGVS